MNRTHIFLIAILSVAALISCKKNTDSPSSLQILFTNKSDIAVPGVAVKLYTSENDLLHNTNILRTQVTDTNGNVLFSNLPIAIYWWRGDKDCLNNMTTRFTSTQAILQNTTTYHYSRLDSTGILKLGNTSALPYVVSTPLTLYTLPAASSRVVFHKTGLFTLTGHPADSTHMDRDTVVQFSCTDTVRVTYPF